MKRSRNAEDKPVRKRRRIDDSEDEASLEEEGESEVSEQETGIELTGKLNLVYEHPPQANSSDKIKVVFKGLWKMAGAT
jgi:hypothetical protein